MASKDLCVRSRHVRHDAARDEVDVEREESRFPSTGRRSGERSERTMSRTVIAARTFDRAGQERFAAFSGDRNPMHMDGLAARRTQAGTCVVHGMHLLLWSLDHLARKSVALDSVARV